MSKTIPVTNLALRLCNLRSIAPVLVAILPFQALAQTSALNLSGTVVDSAGAPLAEVKIELGGSSLTATTGADGKFLLSNSSAIQDPNASAPFSAIRNGALYLTFAEALQANITVYGLRGQALSAYRQSMAAGENALKLSVSEPGIGFFKVVTERSETLIKVIHLQGAMQSETVSHRQIASGFPLAKQAQTAAAYFDVMTATKTGYLKSYLDISNSDTTGLKITMLKTTSPKFSFFVTSMKALQTLSKSDNGFGGDFRFGETGAGAGLRGADKICRTIAETSMPGSGNKGWRAFLSVTADAQGKKVDAISRIGEGPWYDRVGRVMAPTKADLLNTRPMNGDPAIQNDLPNENGIPNHRPDPTKPEDDNHHTITGSTTTGTLYSATATCLDWTSVATTSGKPRAGFSWPRGGGGGGGTSGSHWISGFDAGGCVAGIQVTTSNDGGNIIGSSGGYGGFYCFALNP